jgi:hypothetical protein
MLVAAALWLAVAAVGTAQAAGQDFNTPPPASSVVIFVTSQGLYYDSIVVATLPPHGRFQKLEMTAGGLQTEFGPGDPGYLGGRWWVDVNGNGRMDAQGDLFFMCPLLAPGRTTA